MGCPRLPWATGRHRWGLRCLLSLAQPDARPLPPSTIHSSLPRESLSSGPVWTFVLARKWSVFLPRATVSALLLSRAHPLSTCSLFSVWVVPLTLLLVLWSYLGKSPLFVLFLGFIRSVSSNGS
jgi:hypothetical protein